MNISGIVYDSVVDGEGLRNTIFVSGCFHFCKNCHNPQTWDFNYGYEFTEDLQDEFIEKCKENILLNGITISGGDPIYSYRELIPFLKKYKKKNPTHDIWLYTGFKYEGIKNNEILKLIDVLVDGEYIEELKDSTLSFRGSSNQRIIDVQKSLKENKVILLNI
jgi:anaerobic ribonucleoside-triphosphate reductase activating protein